jgi:hypothetical protein
MNGGEYQESAYFDGIAAGNHTFYVRDARGCVVSQTVEFTQTSHPLALELESRADIDCYGASTGFLKVNASGGAGTYVYQITNGTPQDSGVFEQLAAGVYTILVTDLNGCTTEYKDTILHLYDTLTYETTVKNVSCFEGQDGSITLQVAGGATPYVYELNGENYLSHEFEQLKAGAYQFNITDSKGCYIFTDSIQVTEPDLLVIKEVAVNDIVCYGAKGSIAVRTEGGTAPYTYSYAVNGSTSYTVFTEDTLLGAGTYHLRVTDSLGCVRDTASFNITAPESPLDFSYVQSDYTGFHISCYGGSNGYIILSATGGNGATYSGYTYAMDTGSYQASNRFENINAGFHTFYVKDARGCIVTKTIEFTQSEHPLRLETLAKAGVKCMGDNTGWLEVQAIGEAGPFFFSLNNGPFQESGRFEQLGAGIYTITVRDNNDCRNTITDTIATQYPPMQITATLNDINCFDGSDGAIEVHVAGGVPPFSYQWNEMSTTSSSPENLKAGTYHVRVTDSAGCYMDATFTLTQPEAPLTINISSDYACFAQSNGFVNIAARGGTLPYIYSIDNGQTYQDGSLFNTVAAGAYQVKVVDKQGCIATGSIVITEKNQPHELNFLVASSKSITDTLVLMDISLPKPDSVRWAFDEAAHILDSNPNAPQIIFKEPGSYQVEMTGYYMGCSYTLSKTLEVKEYEAPVLDSTYRSIKSLQASPNPSAGEVNCVVKLSKTYNLTLEVYDVLGIKHYHQSWSQVKELEHLLDLRQLPSGIYLLRAITDSDARDVRLVITK